MTPILTIVCALADLRTNIPSAAALAVPAGKLEKSAAREAHGVPPMRSMSILVQFLIAQSCVTSGGKRCKRPRRMNGCEGHTGSVEIKVIIGRDRRSIVTAYPVGARSEKE